MKWNIFKSKGKGKAPKRGGDGGGRRSTGIATEMPPWVWRVLKTGAFALAAAAVYWGGRELFRQYYFSPHSRFALTDVRRNVEVNAGTLLSPAIIYELLGLADGMNQFSLDIKNTRQAMVTRAPNIKDLTIVRTLPDKMSIAIIERTPIARVDSEEDGWVVDEEGVPFIRYAGTSHLPIIKGADLPAQMQTGKRVHGMTMAAVRVVKSMRRPKVKQQLLEVTVVKEDYLLLTMSDHRQAKFAWNDMAVEKSGIEQKAQELRMQDHYDQLELRMESKVGKICLMWDARVPGRITGMPYNVGL